MYAAKPPLILLLARLAFLSIVGIAVHATVLPSHAQAAKAPGKEAPFSWVAPLPQADLLKRPLPATVKHATFRSPTMGIDVGYYIYLPPGYDAGTERYPVVYHLHGGRPGGEGKSVRLAVFVDRATAAGTIKPTLYVFPNGGPVSWYDMPNLKDGMGESVFINELIPHIDATYRTRAKRAARALEGFSQGGRGTTRIMFKHPELFCSVAPGGSGYGPERRIRDNDGYESPTLRFLPIGNNAWDLAKTFAERKSRPTLSILIWDGTKCFNFEDNRAYSAYLDSLGIAHEFLAIPEVAHTAAGCCDKKGDEIMGHHQRAFDRSRSE